MYPVIVVPLLVVVDPTFVLASHETAIVLFATGVMAVIDGALGNAVEVNTPVGFVTALTFTK